MATYFLKYVNLVERFKITSKLESGGLLKNENPKICSGRLPKNENPKIRSGSGGLSCEKAKICKLRV
ncbi:unnamed protein product [Rhizophagus irregularis]|nr:unnamed protein product [Rhizophagus irregularis]